MAMQCLPPRFLPNVMNAPSHRNIPASPIEFRRAFAILEAGPPTRQASVGAIAQLGERYVRNVEASGSIPLSSTISQIYPDKAAARAGGGQGV